MVIGHSGGGGDGVQTTIRAVTGKRIRGKLKIKNKKNWRGL